MLKAVRGIAVIAIASLLAGAALGGRVNDGCGDKEFDKILFSGWRPTANHEQIY